MEYTLRKILLLNLTIFCLMFLACGAEDSSEEEVKPAKEKIILITSSTGLQLAKEINGDGTINIIYDCSLGLTDEGTIFGGDKIHPEMMSSLIIKNCYNITVKLCEEDNYRVFKKLIIDNVTSISLYLSCNYYYRPQMFSYPQDSFLISISNCGSLHLPKEDSTLQLAAYRNIVFTLENVFIKTLHQHTFTAESRLHFKNVRIENVEADAVYLNKHCLSSLLRNCKEPVLIVENSNFGYVEEGGFTFNGSTVNIFNNTFKNLEERAFSVNKTNSFNFSSNLVERMENPFYVTGSRIDIVHNRFQSSDSPWLSKIETQNEAILNVMHNQIKDMSATFFALHTAKIPAVINFKNNYFNCSCRYISLLTYESWNFVRAVFLNTGNKNVCVNFNNCPLKTVLENMEDLCSGNFECSERLSNEEVLILNTKSILSVLQNIDDKLESLIVKYSST